MEDIFKEQHLRKSVINDGVPFPVKEHVRQLPKKQRPSPEKVKEAAEHGIRLCKYGHKTFVKAYTKNTR